MRRRKYLELLGASVGASALAGCSAFDEDPGPPETETDRETSTSRSTGTSTSETLHHGIEFETVVDAVDDLGMDPNGKVPIDDELKQISTEGTLITFPPGEYLVTEEHRWENAVDSFGILGTGEDRSDVQFVFPEENPYEYYFLNVRGGRDFLLKNITFQQRDNLTTTCANIIRLEDGLQIHDVELAGFSPPDPHSHGSRLKLQIQNPDGVGVVENYVSTGGGVGPEGYPTRKAQILVVTDDKQTHRGELRFENCHIENGGSHSIYGTHHSGCIRVEGGLFKNNDNTNLRISGGRHPSKRSWVKGAKIVIDTDSARKFLDDAFYQNTRGFRIEAPGRRKEVMNHTDLLIENCEVICRSTPNSSGLCRIEPNHGSVTIRNVRFHNEVDNVPIIESLKPNPNKVWGPTQITLDNVVVNSSGRITESWKPKAGVRIVGRSNSSIQQSCVTISANGMNGIAFEDSDDCVVNDTNIDVPGEPLILQNAHPKVTQFTSDNACSLGDVPKP